MSATSASKTLEVPVRGVAGEDKGRLTVPQAGLDKRVRVALLKEAAIMYQANKRVGSHETKTRSQVRGSTRKLWKQKGTGRARPGSCKTPGTRGGGVIFGPHKRDYSYSINRKQRRLAVRSALYSKFLDGQVVVLDGLKIDAPKTKSVAAALGAIGVHGRCLIGTDSHDRNLVLSARNLPGVLVSPLKEFNALDILTAKTVVLTREAFDALCAEPVPVAAEAEVDDGGES